VQHCPDGPAAAVCVSTPPYAEFGPPVDARLLRPCHIAPGTVFGLRALERADAMDLLARQFAELRRCHPSVPLVLCLDGRFDADVASLIQRAALLRVRGVIVAGEPMPDALRRPLTSPADLPADVVDWLSFRVRRLSPEVAELCRAIFREAPAAPGIEALLTSLGESVRTARARLRKLALPSPAHWHQVARAVHSALCLQRRQSSPVFELAMELGYSDHSALSHQLRRLFGMSASQVRGLLGWEWLLDRWLASNAGAALAAS
jgi:AraC-like DNA-binding protein